MMAIKKLASSTSVCVSSLRKKGNDNSYSLLFASKYLLCYYVYRNNGGINDVVHVHFLTF
jgi:hypothetical protein